MSENTFYPENPSDSRLETLLSTEMLQWAKVNGSDFARLMAYYKCAMMEVETKFNVLNTEYSLKLDRNPISSVKARLKKPYSIIEKLRRMDKEISLSSLEENLSDVAGVRVICAFQSDVYMLADALLKQDDVTLVRKKDYIQNPKPNGYRSLHLIVTVPIFLAHEKKVMRVEVQLRTISMDSWASLEHQMRYKKDTSFTDEMAQELLRCAMLSAELDARMDKLGKQTGCHYM
ncbi:MAG: GTP pyrophosphokinase family protein [Clostridia bacterium]|nr:GTP pyrophosphokinase family protein [Clostridia bacterium]